MQLKKKRNEFTMRMAGIAISFEFEHDMTPLADQETKDEFSSGVAGDLSLRVHYGNVPPLGKQELIFDSGETWALYQAEGKYVLQDDAFKPGSVPDTLVVLEPDLKSGRIYFRSDSFHQHHPHDPMGYPLNQVLMIMLLSMGKGVLLHACGIDDGGSGYLFLGQSTHGKSTMAKLWFEDGATVLNDDRIIVREKDGKFWMYGTPWHGDFKEHSSEGLAVQKIFFLTPAEENSAPGRKGAEAVSMLLTRSFPPLWDREGMAYTMDLLHRMAGRIPCYELKFVPDPEIVDFVRSL